MSQIPSIFHAAYKLFINEWLEDEDEDVEIFIKYFKAEWIDINYNWFEGFNHPNDAGTTK